MEIREVLAANLRRHRRAAGWSQEELAHRAEIDRTYISSLENCVYGAGVDVIDSLARALGLEAADLLREPDVGEAADMARRPRERTRRGVSRRSGADDRKL